MNIVSRISKIVDSMGSPIVVSEPEVKSNGKGRLLASKGVGGFSAFNTFNMQGSWLSGLSNVSATPSFRAREPYLNHPWVFAASNAIAITASQLPFVVFRETEDEIKRREFKFKKRYPDKTFRCERGSKRKAIPRWVNIKSEKRLDIQKALEEDFDHPIYELLSNPNPYQNLNQLWQFTDLWLGVRGECFWIYEHLEENENGLPDRIWPMSPDLFEPLLEHRTYGELIAWIFTTPEYGQFREKGARILIDPEDVLCFKLPNPFTLYRGLSRLISAALGIEEDLLIDEFNKAVLENGGDPGGVITYDGNLSDEERKQYLREWEQRHKGSGNISKTAVLSNGFRYNPLTVSAKDMQFSESKKWQRETILGVLGTPPSVLGVTSFINYATQLGQDKNFLEKTILPIKRIEEAAIDSKLFFSEPDDVMGLFDLRDAEALRSGVDEKINISRKMCGPELHCPPSVAYRVVGIEVPAYEGDSISIVQQGLESLTNSIDRPLGEVEEDGSEETPENPEETVPGEENTEGRKEKKKISIELKKVLLRWIRELKEDKPVEISIVTKFMKNNDLNHEKAGLLMEIHKKYYELFKSMGEIGAKKFLINRIKGL